MSTSADGVVTATLMPAYAAIELIVDFTVTGSPIHLTAGSVYAVTVAEQTTGYQVRGMSSAAAPGGAAAGIDGEAPFGTSLSYVAQAFDAAGNLLATSAAATVTLPAPTASPATWLKSLATPALSVNVTTKTLPAWSADITQGVLSMINRPDTVVVQDVRQFETATIELWTGDGATTAALKALLYSPGPYLLQMPFADEADIYVMVGKYDRPRAVNMAAATWFAWSLPLTAVTRPDPTGWSVAIPGHTNADSTARWPLYSNRTGSYLSRATT